ncbi:MAG: exodeoxyribonuclease VII large subunit [Rhodoferax sp.]|nr:exodeoxyribonuclease VII large subunit [Rhodoferax sp.]
MKLGAQPRIWRVGALCQAIANALDARFNPVSVEGEITGFTRAASGHCYFTLRDDTGQLRCAMFRRAASLLDFPPRDGDRVELRGTLGVYEARGELQLVVESMRRAGQGSLFEQFLARKAKLEQEGLFDASRKRALPVCPRGIGVVTSLGAAALHDVVTALQRRVPHLPVVIAPASVQGDTAPAELIRALQSLYAEAGTSQASNAVHIDVILLVRGGGAMEDLWAFNDEGLARVIAQSPVPVVSGVGHETDFTIADFVADLRAPTPTAAAELVALPRAQWAELLESMHGRLEDAVLRKLDRQSQRLDLAVSRLGRPSGFAMRHRLALQSLAQRLGPAARMGWGSHLQDWQQVQLALSAARGSALRTQGGRLDRIDWQLRGLDPAEVLQRGYAWLTDSNGRTVTKVAQVQTGEQLKATLSDGVVDLQVADQAPN